VSESVKRARNSPPEGWQAAATPRTVAAQPGRPAAEETTEFLSRVDRQLAEVLDGLAEAWAVEDTQMVDLLADRDLPELLGSLASTGKRIRPTMCYWGWLAAGGQDRDGTLSDVVRAGTALELLHVFALIHDDVMDESASRRGQPSIHTLAAQLHLLS
jgi:geranylgeranyl diphosphate synthase type I